MTSRQLRKAVKKKRGAEPRSAAQEAVRGDEAGGGSVTGVSCWQVKSEAPRPDVGEEESGSLKGTVQPHKQPHTCCRSFTGAEKSQRFHFRDVKLANNADSKNSDVAEHNC